MTNQTIDRANPDQALGTLPRGEKGPLAPPPTLRGPAERVAAAVRAWPGVVSTIHWHFSSHERVDGVDFYVGEQELGHIHLDGEIHLATPPSLGAEMVREGVARPFRYQRGWVEAAIGTDAEAERAIGLFRRNYERLAPATGVSEA